MNNKTYWIGVVIILIAIVGTGLYLSMQPKAAVAPVAPSTTPSAEVTTPPVTTPATASTYENASMKVTIPTGWTATEAISKTVSNPDAVNITNGQWILYINVNASQASGVEGGRFAEIAMGAPSADAVVTQEPSECGQTETSAAYGNFSRVDYFVSAADKKEWCNVPTNGQTVWFFSYITSPGNGFFNDYTPGSNPGLVITMASTTKTVNDLPVKGSTELNTALKQMTDIAATLVIKKQ